MAYTMEYNAANLNNVVKESLDCGKMFIVYF